VVTGADDVARWCETRGVRLLPDPGRGLDAAVAAGVSGATGSWLVAHGDLPLITADDLEGIAQAADSGTTVLAPSRDGGTNLIAGTAPIRFAYGPGSFVRHLAAARAPRWVLVRPGLAIELDTAADLAAVLHHPRGGWVASLLS
jgi:2-phospho-L-lactate guanylyltransferase